MPEDISKIAQIISSGDPTAVGVQVAQFIKMIVTTMPTDMQAPAIQNIKEKIGQLSITEIVNKKSPPTAAIGQCITFVKTFLKGKHPHYVESVIKSTLSHM